MKMIVVVALRSICHDLPLVAHAAWVRRAPAALTVLALPCPVFQSTKYGMLVHAFPVSKFVPEKVLSQVQVMSLWLCWTVLEVGTECKGPQAVHISFQVPQAVVVVVILSIVGVEDLSL